MPAWWHDHPLRTVIGQVFHVVCSWHAGSIEALDWRILVALPARRRSGCGLRVRLVPPRQLSKRAFRSRAWRVPRSAAEKSETADRLVYKRIPEFDTELTKRLRTSPAWRAKDRSPAQHPGGGAHDLRDLARPTAGTGHPGPQGHRGIGRCCTTRQRQWTTPRQAPHLGRACRGAMCLVHARPHGRPWNTVIRAFSDRLEAAPGNLARSHRGLHRKLLIIMNAMLKCQLALIVNNRLTRNTVAPPSARSADRGRSFTP